MNTTINAAGIINIPPIGPSHSGIESDREKYPTSGDSIQVVTILPETANLLLLSKPIFDQYKSCNVIDTSNGNEYQTTSKTINSECKM